MSENKVTSLTWTFVSFVRNGYTLRWKRVKQVTLLQRPQMCLHLAVAVARDFISKSDSRLTTFGQ